MSQQQQETWYYVAISTIGGMAKFFMPKSMFYHVFVKLLNIQWGFPIKIIEAAFAAGVCALVGAITKDLYTMAKRKYHIYKHKKIRK